MIEKSRTLAVAGAMAVVIGMASSCSGEPTAAALPPSPDAAGTPAPLEPPPSNEPAPALPQPTPEVQPTGVPARDLKAISVMVGGGKVLVGDETVPVRLGQQVALRVVSDKADELHVHGFDITRELQPNQPETVVFTANAPGQFHAELHDQHLELFTLQVQ